MNKRAALASVFALSALVAGGFGCRGPVSELTLTSYKDPYFPEKVDVRLIGAKYRIDAGRDIVIAGKSDPRVQDDLGPVTEYMQVRLFWKPYPGRTFAESSQIDAVVRYVVASNAGTAVYTGTGFAYPKDDWGDLNVAIESGRLQIESRSGDMPDILGEARITGTLRAQKRPAGAADLSRELELVAAQ